jgi:translation elongation factor EF-Tu-like GTPase
MPEYPTDIEAEITFLPTGHGGREGSAVSGYRPQFHYDGHDWDAVHTYPDREQVRPGETVRTFLSFLSPAEHAGKLRPGKAFLVREGNRVVGYGSVTRIIGLEASARRDAGTGTDGGLRPHGG